MHAIEHQLNTTSFLNCSVVRLFASFHEHSKILLATVNVSSLKIVVFYYGIYPGCKMFSSSTTVRHLTPKHACDLQCLCNSSIKVRWRQRNKMILDWPKNGNFKCLVLLFFFFTSFPTPKLLSTYETDHFFISGNTDAWNISARKIANHMYWEENVAQHASTKQIQGWVQSDITVCAQLLASNANSQISFCHCKEVTSLKLQHEMKYKLGFVNSNVHITSD